MMAIMLNGVWLCSPKGIIPCKILKVPEVCTLVITNGMTSKLRTAIHAHLDVSCSTSHFINSLQRDGMLTGCQFGENSRDGEYRIQTHQPNNSQPNEYLYLYVHNWVFQSTLPMWVKLKGTNILYWQS